MNPKDVAARLRKAATTYHDAARLQVAESGDGSETDRTRAEHLEAVSADLGFAAEALELIAWADEKKVDIEYLHYGQWVATWWRGREHGSTNLDALRNAKEKA